MQIRLYAKIITAWVFISLAAFVVWRAYYHPPRLNLPAPLTPIMTTDERSGYTLRPNLSIHYPTNSDQFWIHTDSSGIRVSEPNGTSLNSAEIIAIGDSQTFGHAIENHETYLAQLGKRLNVKVANLGVSGYSSLSALERLERFRHLKPRLIIFGLYHKATITRNLNPCYPGFSLFCISVPHLDRDETAPPSDNTISLKATGGYLHYKSSPKEHSFVKDVFWTAVFETNRLSEIIGLTKSYRKDVLSQRPQIYRSTVNRTLAMVKERADRLGTKLIVLHIPYYQGPEIEPMAKEVKESADSLSLSLIDSVPVLQAIKDANPNNPKILEVPGDGHLTAAAHAAISELIAEHILAFNLLGER